jgi:hypothetical protein
VVRIGLIGDVRAKHGVAAPAKELFVSPLFQARRKYAERVCDRWFVLSAAHGLLHPDQVVKPYDRSLANEPRAVKEQWSRKVLWQLDQAWTIWRDTVVEIHGPDEYRSFGVVDGLEERGAVVDIPAEHLTGGEQLAFYASAEVIDLTEAAADPAANLPSFGPAAARPRPD